MGYEGILHSSLSAPNLMNVCIDRYEQGEFSGRIFHYYQKEPVVFQNMIDLLREAENLFDILRFPQAAKKTRSLLKKEGCAEHPKEPMEKEVSLEEMLEHHGEVGTFLVAVKYRQNSTWQGEFCWLENNKVQEFFNILEFMKLLEMDLMKTAQINS